MTFDIARHIVVDRSWVEVDQPEPGGRVGRGPITLIHDAGFEHVDGGTGPDNACRFTFVAGRRADLHRGAIVIDPDRGF